jgi:hypothetical protein
MLPHGLRRRPEFADGTSDIGTLRIRFLGSSLWAPHALMVAVALPLTVGMEIGLYSGFPMVRSNFPCP